MSKREYYNNYKWDKCSITQFYLNINQWMDYEKAIQPWRTKRVSNWKYAKLMEFYYNYQWEKVDEMKYYNRVRYWVPPARAILKDCKTNDVKEQKIENFKKTVSEKKVYKIKPKKWKDREDEKRIEIKYSKEEAQAFRKIYNIMIDDLEYKIEERIDLNENKKKLEHLKTEIYLFNTVNNEW